MREVTWVSATDMARSAGVESKALRAALRSAAFPWHSHFERWTVPSGGIEHRQMQDVLAGLVARRTSVLPAHSTGKAFSARRSSKDEHYVIDMCDEVLGAQASRQHCFAFLLGDPGKTGARRCLPVDAFYPGLNLVVEYHERQHSEAVALFDRRLTVSGVDRGAQRKRYDERRKVVLPQNGIRLVILDYSEFAHTSDRKLRRMPGDKEVIERRLADV